MTAGTKANTSIIYKPSFQQISHLILMQLYTICPFKLVVYNWGSRRFDDKIISPRSLCFVAAGVRTRVFWPQSLKVNGTTEVNNGDVPLILRYTSKTSQRKESESFAMFLGSPGLQFPHPVDEAVYTRWSIRFLLSPKLYGSIIQPWR